MTVIRPNSIAGINSITVQSGQALNIHDASGNIIRNITSSSGVSTFSSLHIGSGTTTSTQGISVGTGCSIVSDAVNTLDVYTAASKRLRIKSDGNVEIGGGTHSRRLAVHDTTNSVILIEGASNGTSNLMFGDENDEDVGMLGYNHGSNYLAFTVNAAERLRITSAGKVGIGTDDPGQTLHLSASSGDVYNRVDTNVNDGMLIYVQGTQRSVFANDSAFSGTTTDTGIGAKGNMIFRTGTSSFDERVRIGTSGQIGLGGANYGTSGQVLTSGGSGAAPSWAAAGGITMAEHWRLTSSTNGNQSPLTAWEAADNSFAGNLGSSMTVSSGVFTFPATGMYWVIFTLVGYSDNHTQNVIGSIKYTGNDGGAWQNAAYGLQGIYDFNNSYPSWGNTACHYIFDIFDLSDQKIRFDYGAGQGGEYVKGDSNISYTSATFIRLGDT